MFDSKDSELGHTDILKMKIDTGQHLPIKLKAYRAILHKREVIDKAVDEMLSANSIRKSISPWSFPVVTVDKKDGSKRFCVDFRKCYQITKSNYYPLPLIDDIIALLGNAKYYSSLDIKSGYWQIAMEDSDKEKTAFVCHKGLSEFNVLPFAVCNAPSIFSEMMGIVLEGLDKFAIAYLDDILIYSKTLEEHIKHIQVFDRLRQHNLKLKLKNCNFLQTETTYLCFVINSKGIQPDPKKIEAIKSLQQPTTVKQVCSIIGACCYYRRFIPNFSEIAEPIIKLTGKYAKFHWTPQCKNLFNF